MPVQMPFHIQLFEAAVEVHTKASCVLLRFTITSSFSLTRHGKMLVSDELFVYLGLFKGSLGEEFQTAKSFFAVNFFAAKLSLRKTQCCSDEGL